MKYITLPCNPEDDLTWEDQIEEASACESICWCLDFGFHESKLDFFHETRFQALVLSLDEFAKRILGPFAEKSHAVTLYWGPLFFQYLENDAFHAHLAESGQSQELFAMTLFSEYLHRLLSFLPDDLPAFAVFEGGDKLPPSVQAQLFSKQRFPYISVAFQEPILEAAPEMPQGLVVPADELFSERVHEIFNRLVEELGAVRYIHESLLCDSWDNLDEVYLVEEALSKACARMVTGFLSAGGIACFVREEKGQLILEKKEL